MGAATRGLLRLFLVSSVLLFTFNSVQLIRYWRNQPFPVEVTIAAIVSNCVFSLGIIFKLLHDIIGGCRDREPQWQSV